jgi:signal transduction histidine kinase
MGRVNKLLNRQFRAFTLYALVVLVCSIPAYFFIVENIWLSELDEHNKIIAIQTQAGFDSLSLTESEILEIVMLWNKTRPGYNLTPSATTQAKPDSSYEIIRQVGFESGVETDRFRGLVTSIHINETPYRLTVETNVEESEETITVIAMITVVFFFILVIGFVVLNKKLAVKTWQPFNDTLNKLSSFDLHSKDSLKLEPSDIAEFNTLNAVLTRLIEKNIATYKEQKAFTENASHELQTPLAIIQSKLDLFLQSKELTREQSGLIDQVNRTLSRISHLNKNLLLLSKIDNDQFHELETISLSELCRESITLLSDVIQERGLRIEVYSEKEINITANRVLFEVLINNLLSNAIRHNTAQGFIILRLSADMLQVCNSGTNTLDADALYKRFMNVDKGSPGSGLGLAIAKQVCNRYNWSLHYYFKDGLHRFSVSF